MKKGPPMKKDGEELSSGVYSQSEKLKEGGFLKTVLICKSMNLRLEGDDHRPYRTNERIYIKYQGRWIPMLIEDIRESGGVRQIFLRVLTPTMRVLSTPPSFPTHRENDSSPTWIDELIQKIQGKRGRVVW
jgi:hypothetical protein